MGVTAHNNDPGPSGGEGVHIAEGFDFKAVSKEVRSAEQDQTLDFASGMDRLFSRTDAFKAGAATAWSKALDVLGDAHREAVRPLPGYADKIEDAGTAYHGTDDGNAHNIGSVI